jgi:hypothetical protein
MATQTFRLVTSFEDIGRRSFDLASPGILKATDTNPIVSGEFFQLDGDYKMARGTVNPAVVPSYVFYGEPGRTEMQALQKGTFLFHRGPYEAETKVMTSTSIVVGSALEVADVTYGGKTRRGLVLRTSGVVVGYATKLPANNDGWLRFRTAL